MKNILLIALFLLVVLIHQFMTPAYLVGQDVDSNHSITLFDLTYTLDMNPDSQKSVEKSWDHAHTISTLQGIVNRDAPRLYLFFVENDGINIDRFWWNTFSAPGKWLSGSKTETINNIIELISVYRSEIN